MTTKITGTPLTIEQVRATHWLFRGAEFSPGDDSIINVPAYPAVHFPIFRMDDGGFFYSGKDLDTLEDAATYAASVNNIKERPIVGGLKWSQVRLDAEAARAEVDRIDDEIRALRARRDKVLKVMDALHVIESVDL